MMNQNSNSEKKCRKCGRIITDKDNKLGFCPYCKEKIMETGSIVALATIVLRNIPKIIKRFKYK